MKQKHGLHIHITGIVQGVGFRPFVYGLATRMNLSGWVRNTSAGVDIEVDGTEDQLDEFIRTLKNDFPPLARIDSLQVEACPPNGFSAFEILHSEPIPGAFIPISPDVSICEDCLREMLDPTDRRYLYPFINCTNCGPRFTIIQDIPYDRPKTTMGPFEMCPDCAAEYHDPLDRRFHAQPVACPICGPHIWIETIEDSRLKIEGESPIINHQSSMDNDVIQLARKYLSSGKILAIKGLGGFHLACDATNPEAVTELRRRKLRVDKPFALMMPDIETIEQHCHVNESERQLLLSHQRPIVLLDRKPDSNIVPAVAPNQNTLGVMLPYTPLHYLLFADRRPETEDRSPVPRPPSALVMTSGNLSEEPIATDNDEARQRLASLAEAFLMHNRNIHVRCDDSVVRVARYQVSGDQDANTQLPDTKSPDYLLRRSRGYAPNPIKLPWDSPPLLATGAELKNTFCLTKEHYAFLSHHIGDLENYETLQSFEDGIEHFERLFRITPQAIACDLHPNYLATRYALERAQCSNLPTFNIQHHHAHIAACLADNELTGDHPVIGVSFDGTGYGEDGAIWGGEFLVVDYEGYQRFAHLEYAPLPGGDAATRKPFRIALAYLWQAGIPWDEVLPPVISACGDELSMLHTMLENNINCPMTSSMGRLFDAVSALAGVRAEVNYEAQAAIELEALVDPNEEGAYPFDLNRRPMTDDREIPSSVFRPSSAVVDPSPMLHAIAADLRTGVPIPKIATRFHNGVAQMAAQVCMAMRSQFGVNEVALSGGVWQNMTLLYKTVPLLQNHGFTVYIHRQVPPNDGGLALGQAAIAAHRLKTMR